MTYMDQDAGTTGANGSPRQGEQLQEAASGLISQAARTAEAQASTTMTKVGETLDQVAQAIRDASTGLRETQPDIAGFAETAADRVDGAAAYLREHGPSDAIDNVQRMARQQPALVLGGGLAVGLLLGRLLRSGASAVDTGKGSYGYGSGGSRYGYGAGGHGATGYGAGEYGSGGYGAAGYGAGSTGAAGTYGDIVESTDPGAGLAATDAAADSAYASGSATDDGVRDEAPTTRRSR